MDYYSFVRERLTVLRWSEVQALRACGKWTDRDLVAFARDGDLEDPLVLALASCEPDDREVPERVARLAARDVDAEPEQVRLVVDLSLAQLREDDSRVFAALEALFYSLDCPDPLRPFMCDDEPFDTSETLEERETHLVAKAARFANDEAARLSARAPR